VSDAAFRAGESSRLSQSTLRLVSSRPLIEFFAPVRHSGRWVEVQSFEWRGKTSLLDTMWPSKISFHLTVVQVEPPTQINFSFHRIFHQFIRSEELVLTQLTLREGWRFILQRQDH
jgi:hypothetical protein